MKRTTAMAFKILLALLLLTGLGRILPESQHTLANQFRAVDLAALGLTPEDLEEVGLEGYGTAYGVLRSASEFAASVASQEGYSTATALASVEEMGLQRTYTLPLSLPIEGGGFEDVETAGVWFTILEFDTETNAALMFDMVDDDINSGRRDVVDGTHRIGNDSILSRSDTENAGTGDPVSDLMLEFHAGVFYVMVNVFDVARDGEFAAPAKPIVSVVEKLGDILLDRISSAPNSPLPALGTQVLRLKAEDGAVVTVADRYSAFDGEPHRRYGETDDDIVSRSDMMERDRLVASYVVEQDVTSSDVVAPGDPHLIVRLYEFEDGDAAAEWLEEAALDRYSEEDFVTEIEPIRLSSDLGDRSMAASYEGIYRDADLVGQVVWVQVNEVVARISLDATEPIDTAIIEQLAEEQVSCLRGGFCESIDVPTALT